MPVLAGVLGIPVKTVIRQLDELVFARIAVQVAHHAGRHAICWRAAQQHMERSRCAATHLRPSKAGRTQAVAASSAATDTVLQALR
jgi:hypothetical protein